MLILTAWKGSFSPNDNLNGQVRFFSQFPSLLSWFLLRNLTFSRHSKSATPYKSLFSAGSYWFNQTIIPTTAGKRPLSASRAKSKAQCFWLLNSFFEFLSRADQFKMIFIQKLLFSRCKIILFTTAYSKRGSGAAGTAQETRTRKWRENGQKMHKSCWLCPTKWKKKSETKMFAKPLLLLI